MLDLAIKNLLENRVRTILTALGIIIAITAIVSLGSISTGLNELVTSSTSSIGSDTIFVMKEFDMSEMAGPPGSFEMESLTAEEVDDVLSVSGVERGVPIISKQFGGLFEIDGIDIDSVDLFGAEDLSFAEGSWPDNEDKGAAIGYLVAHSRGVVVGDYITFKGEEVEIVGIFEEGSGSYDLVVIIPYTYAEEIYDMEGEATQVILKPDDISLVQEIKDIINNDMDGLSAMTMEDALAQMEEMTGTLNIMTFGIGFVASLVAAIGIIITMYTSVLERRRQLGIMKAVGALRKTILIQILEEGIILSIFSSIIAVILSFFFVDILNNVLLGGSNLALITPALAGGAVAYGVLLTVFSSIYPAWIATNTDPIRAIRDG